MKRIETKDLGLFEYERFEFTSKRLDQKQTFGTIRPKGKRPKATIYYLHAGNTGDRMMLELEFIERMDKETAEFLVEREVQFALPNFGLNFLLSSKEDPKRPFHEYFFEEVMPLAEEGTDTTSASRFLSGPSLGGHTGLVAFLRRPEHFKGVASTMGAMLNFDFYSDTELEKYVREAGLSSDYATMAKQIFRGCFDSYETYQKINPMILLNQVEKQALQGKRIMIDTGGSDDFGFHVSMSDFSDALNKKGVPHHFELVDGGRHEPAFVMSRFSPMLRYLLG